MGTAEPYFRPIDNPLIIFAHASWLLLQTLLAIVLHRFSFTLGHPSGDEAGADIEIETFQSFVIRPRVVGETRTSLPLTIHRLE